MPPWNPNPQNNKRCRFFDDNGNELGGGCRKASTCRFLHPGDERWPTGISTYNTKPYRAGDPYSPKYRSRRSDWRSSRRSTPSRSRSRSRSPRHRKQHTKEDSISSSVASEAGPSSRINDRHIPPPPPPSKPTQGDADAHRSGSLDRSGVTTSSVNQTTPLPTPPASGNVNDPKRSFSGLASTSTAMGPQYTSSPTCMSPSFDFPTMPPTGPKALRTASGATNTTFTAPRVSATQQSPAPAQMSPPPPPPQPAEPAPMPPPQPLPDIPSGLTADSSSPVVDLDIKTKLSSVDGKIKSITKYADLQKRLASLEEDYQKATQLMQTPNYAALPDVDKATYKDRYDSLASQYEETKKDCEDSRLDILKTESWPTLPPDTTNLDEQILEKHTELLDFVRDLHAMAAEMVRLLGDIAVPPPSALFLPESEDEDGGEGEEEEKEEEKEEHPGSAMDVDQPAPPPQAESSTAPPPLPTQKKKRRSRSKNDTRSEAKVSRRDRELISNKLTSYEERIATLFNELDVNDNERKEVFREMVDGRLEEVFAANEEENREWDERQLQREEEGANALAQVQAVAQSTYDEVGQLADEIGSMMQDAEMLAQEVEREKAEKAEALQRLTLVEHRLEEYMTLHKTYEQNIASLRSTIHSHITRPPSPPLSPLIPSPEIILSNIERNVNETLRQNMIPMIEEFRGQMEGIIEKRGKEIYGTMWTTVNPTMKILDQIQAKIASMTPPSARAGAGAEAGQSGSMVGQGQS